jgi:uncharacterized protein YkwD
MRKILHSSLFLLVALAVVPAISQAATKTTFSASSESQVLVLLNTIRQQHGLSTFTTAGNLQAAARAHSSDMIARDYFDHNSPTQTFDARIVQYTKSPLVGETIAWGTGQYGTPAGIVSMWMHSPEHRHIILMGAMHHIGLGIATGTFQGSDGAVLATADFSA